MVSRFTCVSDHRSYYFTRLLTGCRVNNVRYDNSRFMQRPPYWTTDSELNDSVRTWTRFVIRSWYTANPIDSGECCDASQYHDSASVFASASAPGAGAGATVAAHPQCAGRPKHQPGCTSTSIYCTRPSQGASATVTVHGFTTPLGLVGKNGL